MKRNLISTFFILSAIVFTIACSKDYSFEKPVDQRMAKGRLTDTAGNCYADSVAGTFYNGVTPGPDTAYVQINVWVDSVGNYVIKTDLQNGFSFSDSGFFNTPGLNTIKLKPVGTPILQKTTDFTVSFDSTFCSFSVLVNDSTGTGLGGNPNLDTINNSDTAWYFSDDQQKYNGSIDSALVYFDTLSNTNFLIINGTTAATGDSLLLITIPTDSGVIVPGVYNTNLGSGFYFSIFTGSVTQPIYVAQADSRGANITIILDYDATNKIVTGTFSGTAVDLSGNIKNITEGKFKAKLLP